MSEPKDKNTGSTVVYSYGGQYDPKTKTLSNLNIKAREADSTEERVVNSGRPPGSTREKIEAGLRDKYNALKKENSTLKKRIRELEAQNSRYRQAIEKLSRVFASIRAEAEQEG